MASNLNEGKVGGNKEELSEVDEKEVFEEDGDEEISSNMKTSSTHGPAH